MRSCFEEVISEVTVEILARTGDLKVMKSKTEEKKKGKIFLKGADWLMILLKYVRTKHA